MICILPPNRPYGFSKWLKIRISDRQTLLLESLDYLVMKIYDPTVNITIG